MRSTLLALFAVALFATVMLTACTSAPQQTTVSPTTGNTATGGATQVPADAQVTVDKTVVDPSDSVKLGELI